jgi:hypothetical protein
MGEMRSAYKVLVGKSEGKMLVCSVMAILLSFFEQ